MTFKTLETRYGSINLDKRVDSDGDLELSFINKDHSEIVSRWINRDQALEIINHLVETFDVSMSTTDGEGSPRARFHHLLDELETRFPDPNPYSAEPVENRYLRMIDKAQLKMKEELCDAEEIELDLLLELHLDGAFQLGL